MAAKKKRAKAPKRKATRRSPVKRRKAAKRKPVKRRKVAKRKVAKRSPVKRRKAAKRKPVKRKATRRVKKRTVTKAVVVRTVGKVRRKRKRSPAKRRVVMAGRSYRRRSVNGSGKGGGLLIALALGAGALYLLSKSRTPATGNYQLPPITQTSNVTRNNQANNIVNYAVAAGLAIDAITRLIEKLNRSDDNELKNIYDHVNTTGDVSSLA